MKDSRFFGCVLLLAYGFLGCDSTGQKPADIRVLARVGDKEFTTESLETALDVLYRPGVPRPEGVERRVLQRLIDTELLVIEARSRGLQHDWKVTTRVNDRERQLLVEELFRRGILEESAKVTREEALFFYDRNHIGEQRRLRRILVGDPDTAKEVKRRVESGEVFAELARELSDDGETAQKGGDMGWMSRLSFTSPKLVRAVFKAGEGELIGPIPEGRGEFTWLMVTDRRHVPFDSVAVQVEMVVRDHNRAVKTARFLEDLADRAGVEDHGEALQQLFARLTESGDDKPKLQKSEKSKLLLSADGKSWTVGQFMSAMLSEPNQQVEIRTVEDLRFYARRLFAHKSLLTEWADELGLRDTEYVEKGVEKTLRAALVDRLRELEVEERIDPSESEIRRHFDEHRDDYVIDDHVSIQEVLVKTRGEADSLLRLVEDGADFDDIARRNSIRSPKVRRAGGRVRLLKRHTYERLGYEAADAEVGELVGPVKTYRGYSVFRVLGKTPGYRLPFEKGRFRAARQLRHELSTRKFEKLLGHLNERYDDRVTVYEDHLRAYVSRGDVAAKAG